MIWLSVNLSLLLSQLLRDTRNGSGLHAVPMFFHSHCTTVCDSYPACVSRGRTYATPLGSMVMQLCYPDGVGGFPCGLVF